MKTKFTCLVVLFLFFSNIGFPNNENSPEKPKFYINSNNSENDLDAAFFADCPTEVTGNSITPSTNEICSGGSVSFTGSEPDITMDVDTTYQWQSKTGTGSWTDISGETGQNYNTDPLTETTSFRRLVVIAGCATEYASDGVTITVNPIPVAPTSGVPAEICFGEDNTAISASVETGETIDWYADATGGTALTSGKLSYTSTETAASVYTYYAEARNTTTNCVSSTRLAVNYTIKESPTLSLDGTECSTDLLTYTITFVSDGEVSSTAGTVDNTAKTVTGIASGTGVTLTATLNGCTTDLVVTAPSCSCPAVAAPTSGVPAEICFGEDNTAISASVEIGETIDWYADATGGTALTSGKLSYTSTETAASVYTYYAEARNTTTNCVSSTRLAVNYTIKESPTLSLDGTECSTDLLTYTITFVSDGEVSSTAGTVDNTAKTVTGIASGTGVTLTATLNGCTTDLVVTAPSCSCPAVAAPTSGVPAEICFGEDNTAISASVETGETIDWYADATGGTALASGKLSYTSTETAASVYTYYAEARNTTTNCVSSTRLAVNYTIKESPTLSLDGTECSTDLLTYTITFVSDGEVSSTAGTVDNTAKTVTGIASGTGVTLTATLNGCTTDLVVTAPSCSCPAVAAPTSGVPAEICFGEDNTAISASVETGETIDWYADATGGTALLSGSLSYTITETAVGVYTYYAEARNTTTNCVSSTRLAVTAEIISTPSIDNITETDPPYCGAQGALGFTFSNVPNGTYTIAYDGAGFSGVIVSAGKATVYAYAGTYSNLKITVNGCTSASDIEASLSDPNPPSTPSISVQNNCGESVLTASNYSGTLTWSTGEHTESIIVDTNGDYSVTQTFNGCTSDAATATATPKTIPAITDVTENNPTSCSGNGSLDFTFANVPDGSYTITYDGGNFSSVAVSGNEATVTAPAGNYNNLAIAVNGCTSESSISASLTEPTPPAAPTITVENNCGESVLTASDYTGTLSWSTGESSQSITVSDAGQYSLTQTIDGCTSDAATATATPKSIPAITDVKENAPTSCMGDGSLELTFTNVPDGAYNIVYDGSSFSNVQITNNKATVVASAGSYNNLKITVNGCSSASGVSASLSDPNPPSAPTIIVSDDCGESVLTASSYTGTLSWSTGESTESITVYTAGNYSLTQIIEGCTSDAATATAAPKTIPAILNVTENNPATCQGQGSLNFTFSGVAAGNYTIVYDGGSFTNVAVAGNTATVFAPAGTYNNLTVTVNGCSSASGVSASLSDPNPPSAPTIIVSDDCGESVLTASNYTGTLLWSTGESTESIIVDAGEYSLTQTVNGCTSDAAVATAAPKTIPVITNVTANDPTVCQGEGSLKFTFSGVPNGTYTITFDGNSFRNVDVSNNSATVLATARRYNNLKITVSGCTSASGVYTSLSDPNPPPAPTISVEDYCGESVLTASDYTGSLTWDTGETTESITVYTAREYSLTQTVDGCTSDAATAEANPKKSSLVPEIDVINNCGESQVTVNNLTADAWLFWQLGDTKDSIQSNSFTVYEEGEYTIYQKIGNCSSLDAIASVNPLDVPSPPAGSDKEICATEPIQTLTAEATSSESNTVVHWFDSESGGNEISSPVLDAIGTVTYYAESQNSLTGCTSESRTPVTLTIKPNPKTALLDTTIIGKPKSNVAVLIFPDDELKYQWYLNNNEITNATKQYYYIIESERLQGNVFTVEVELENGCSAKFNYSYSGNAVDGEATAFKSSNLIDDNYSFTIYPNPANNNLNIAVDSKQQNEDEEFSVKIYSATGARIIDTPLDQNPKSIDIGYLQPGIYSVAIYNTHSRLITKKLVVTKH